MQCNNEYVIEMLPRFRFPLAQEFERGRSEANVLSKFFHVPLAVRGGGW
jgi:hypothetical protein